MAEEEEEPTYVYLDFSEKLAPTIFENKLFLRISNLHKSNPLIQINDVLFKGTFDECVGTNLFFEEVEDPPLKTSIFEKDTPIHLRHVIAQTKTIRLKQIKLPRKLTFNQKSEAPVRLNLNQGYYGLLEKLRDGSLSLEGMACKPEDMPINCAEDLDFEEHPEVAPEPEKEIYCYLNALGTSSASSELELKYERLKRLARRPVRRMINQEPVEECEDKYKDAYEYNSLECQMLKINDTFRSVSSPIIETGLVGGIDVDKCVLHGLIPPSRDLKRVLTPQERTKLLTIDNLANLSLPARYLLLKQCASNIDRLIEESKPEELSQLDENGKSIMDICNVLKRLTAALEFHISPSSRPVKVTARGACADEDYYVKYKYDPSSDLMLNYASVFDESEWTTNARSSIRDGSDSDQNEGDDTGDSEDMDEHEYTNETF